MIKQMQDLILQFCFVFGSEISTMCEIYKHISPIFTMEAWKITAVWFKYQLRVG